MVSPGNTRGLWARAQPATIAATARAAEARARPKWWRQTRNKVINPAAAETATIAAPPSLVSPWNRGGASERTTTRPTAAGACADACGEGAGAEVALQGPLAQPVCIGGEVDRGEV